MSNLLSIILAIALIPVAALADDHDRGGKGGAKYGGHEPGQASR